MSLNKLISLENSTNTKLLKSGDIMSGDLDLNSHKLRNITDPTRLYIQNHMNSKIINNLAETLLWKYYTRHAEYVYKIEKVSSSELHDNTFGQLNTSQTINGTRPLLSSKSKRVNKRYFLKFDRNQRLTSNIDLNSASGQPDITNIFILYQLRGFDENSYWTRNRLFGHNGKHGKFISFYHHQIKRLHVNWTLIQSKQKYWIL